MVFNDQIWMYTKNNNSSFLKRGDTSFSKNKSNPLNLNVPSCSPYARSISMKISPESTAFKVEVRKFNLGGSFMKMSKLTKSHKAAGKLAARVCPTFGKAVSMRIKKLKEKKHERTYRLKKSAKRH